MASPNIRSYYDGNVSRTEVDPQMPVIQPMTARDQLMALIDNESSKMVPGLQAPRMAPRGLPAAKSQHMVRPMKQGSNSERQMSPAGGGMGGPNPDMVTPRSLGRFQMNQFGNWGTFVDPLDIPAGLQDKIMGGFYGGTGNWDSSNPSIMGPQQWRTGKYTHSGGVSMPSQVQEEKQSSNNGFDYLTPLEQARWLDAMKRG